MTAARIATIPLCVGCREERAAARDKTHVQGLAMHDERCACYVNVPSRPLVGAMHVHSADEPRPWVTGARGGRYDVPAPARRKV